MVTEFSTTQIATMVPVIVCIGLGVSIFGALIACFISNGAEKRKKRIRERRMKAILNGDINDYEDYLLYKLNKDQKNGYILNYRDYQIQQLNSPSRR